MKHLFFFAIFLGAILISGTLPIQTFGDVISPRQQIKLNFSSEQVICSEGFVKIFKKSSDKPTCVKPATAEKLAQNGWAKKLSVEKLDEIKMMKAKTGESIGNIKKIAVLKQLTKNIKAGTSSNISGYAFVFDACSGPNEIRTPEIIATSDSETKSVKLGSTLNPNSCYTTSVLIKAANPDSISAIMINTGSISEKISSLETQITDLKNKILTAKQNIPKSTDSSMIPESMTNITTMKKELQNLQDQLRRYMMALYVPPNIKVSKLDIPKSITGKPLEGITTNTISVTESVIKPESENPDVKRFNVVFEACAGKETVRLPIISVTSDSDSVDVKFVDRIIPESCQVGITRINAMDSESITTQISGNSGVSKQIADLEKQVKDLETKLASERTSLNKMVSKQLSPSEEEIASQITLNISQIRQELLETRAQLYGLLLQVK